MIGHVLVVLGHFLAYTYVRLALERIPDVDASTIVVLLALTGGFEALAVIANGARRASSFACIGRPRDCSAAPRCSIAVHAES